MDRRSSGSGDDRRLPDSAPSSGESSGSGGQHPLEAHGLASATAQKHFLRRQIMPFPRRSLDTVAHPDRSSALTRFRTPSSETAVSPGTSLRLSGANVVISSSCADAAVDANARTSAMSAGSMRLTTAAATGAPGLSVRSSGDAPRECGSPQRGFVLAASCRWSNHSRGAKRRCRKSTGTRKDALQP
jgi:hypothetical protein